MGEPGDTAVASASSAYSAGRSASPATAIATCSLEQPGQALAELQVPGLAAEGLRLAATSARSSSAERGLTSFRGQVVGQQRAA